MERKKEFLKNFDMVDKIFKEHLTVIQNLYDECGPAIQQLGEKVAQTLASEGTIFFCGNGGSAADSQHLAAEIVGRFARERRGYPAIALTVDSSVLTAVANDYGYEHIFERQIEALGRPGDLLVGISTSGRSANVLHAVQKATTLGLYTVGLTGKDGEALKASVDLCIVVPSDTTARIQEAHILIGHVICQIIEAKLLD